MRISELILDDKNEIDGIVGTINLISKKNTNKKGNIIKEKKKIKEILKKFKNKTDFIISQKRKNGFVFEMIFDSKNRMDIEILDKNKLNAIIDKMRNKMGNIGYDLNFNENKEKIEIFFKLKLKKYFSPNNVITLIFSFFSLSIFFSLLEILVSSSSFSLPVFFIKKSFNSLEASFEFLYIE